MCFDKENEANQITVVMLSMGTAASESGERSHRQATQNPPCAKCGQGSREKIAEDIIKGKQFAAIPCNDPDLLLYRHRTFLDSASHIPEQRISHS